MTIPFLDESGRELSRPSGILYESVNVCSVEYEIVVDALDT